MSGGGVYSKDGELIGIHGAGEAIQSGDSNKPALTLQSRLMTLLRTIVPR